MFVILFLKCVVHGHLYLGIVFRGYLLYHVGLVAIDLLDDATSYSLKVPKPLSTLRPAFVVVVFSTSSLVVVLSQDKEVACFTPSPMVHPSNCNWAIRSVTYFTKRCLPHLSPLA